MCSLCFFPILLIDVLSWYISICLILICGFNESHNYYLFGLSKKKKDETRNYCLSPWYTLVISSEDLEFMVSLNFCSEGKKSDSLTESELPFLSPFSSFPPHHSPSLMHPWPS